MEAITARARLNVLDGAADSFSSYKGRVVADFATEHLGRGRDDVWRDGIFLLLALEQGIKVSRPMQVSHQPPGTNLTDTWGEP